MKATKFVLALAATLVVLLSPRAVLADSVVQFAASGTFSNGTTLGGYITIDTTTGTITSDLTWSSDSNPFTQILAVASGSPTTTLVEISDGFGGEIDLVIPSTLTDYAGGSLCAVSGSPAGCPPTNVTLAVSQASNALGQGFNLDAGQLTPSTTAVPEPASLLLLGTGLLSLLVVAALKLQPA